MSDFVIDASVAIKWVIAEPDTPRALALRRHRLFAPELLIAECANVLWKKVKRNELNRSEAVVAARLLARAEIELAPMRALLEDATALAITLDHSAYDCVYLALAESLSCDLVTADTRFAAKTLPRGCRSKMVALNAVALP